MLFFNRYNFEASKQDRQIFSTPGAPSWEAAVEESNEILATHRQAIVVMSNAIIKAQRVSMSLWPDFGMNGTTMHFKQILSDEEVQKIIAGNPEWATPGTGTESPQQRSAASLAHEMGT